MIFVTFKTYQEASGANAVHLALICQKTANDTNVPIVAVVQPLDAATVKKSITTPVWLQHTDPFKPGAHTGYIDIATAISYGISGTLLNHSEHPLSLEQITQTMKTINLYHVSAMVCAPNLDELIRFAKLTPDF